MLLNILQFSLLFFALRNKFPTETFFFNFLSSKSTKKTFSFFLTKKFHEVHDECRILSPSISQYWIFIRMVKKSFPAMLYIDTVATEKREEGKRASRRNKINESFFLEQWSSLWWEVEPEKSSHKSYESYLKRGGIFIRFLSTWKYAYEL